MKKILSMLLVLSMLFGCSVAMAEMGVQVIGGPDVDIEPVSLDDVKLNASVSIDGYADIFLTEFSYKDILGFYVQGKHDIDPYKDWYYVSGADADFAVLRVDLTNLSTKDKQFLENCEVKVVFDDTYEYGGWCYQYNYNNATYDWSGTFGSLNKIQNTEFVINKEDVFAVGPMYTGHYAFGCTLPNAVINSKKPLRLVITIDGNEITYNIRK